MKCEKCNSERTAQICKNCKLNREYYEPKKIELLLCSECKILKPLSSIGICKDCLTAEGCKECNKCSVVKDLKNFYAKQAVCKDCYKFKNSKYHLKTYGLSANDYDVLYNKQNGDCAICKLPKKLNVDRCHKTGKVRGLLCSACNTSLGGFFDNKELLRGAIDYLGGNKNSYGDFLTSEEIQVKKRVKTLNNQYNIAAEILNSKNKKADFLEIRNKERQKIELELTINKLKSELMEILSVVYQKYEKDSIDSRYQITDELLK